jgi:hypothetical protein
VDRTPTCEEDRMTEVPGTDRDQARENVLRETPTAPEDVEGADDAPTGDEGQTGDDAKPAPGSTDPGT